MSNPWEADNCAAMKAHYAVYSIPQAAALWCGVPQDLIDETVQEATPLSESGIGRSIWTHPDVPCLEPRSRAIAEAIENGELPYGREDAKPVAPGDHVAYERRHFFGRDLKTWMEKSLPDERPAFLFDSNGLDAEHVGPVIEWGNKALWSEKELQELCCGLEPDGPRENTAELNEVLEEIRRSVLAGVLRCIEPVDATDGDRFYGHSRFFRPQEAIEWASQRFPKFPDFPKQKSADTSHLGTRWPWGTHNTKLLTKLSEAAEKFWKLYDPEDPSTAPTNEQVEAWLMEKDVSKRIAQTIATILRADNLPTGPRK